MELGSPNIVFFILSEARRDSDRFLTRTQEASAITTGDHVEMSLSVSVVKALNKATIEESKGK